MKTPRELILQRHRATEPKLKAIRKEDLAAVVHQLRRSRRERIDQSLLTSAATLVVRFWRESIWPCRRIWLGLATTWVLILVSNLNSSESPAIVPKTTPPPNSAVLTALHEQRRLMAQLLAPTAPAPAKIPRPRSQLRDTLKNSSLPTNARAVGQSQT